MAGGGEATGVQAAAARGDEEPAPTEQENSETSERQGSATDEWNWSDHSQGVAWGDAGWHSRPWNRDWWGSAQPDSGSHDYDRRGSWTSSWGNYSTEAFSGSRTWRSGRSDDDYFGGDGRRGDRDPRAGPSDLIRRNLARSLGGWRRARHRLWHDSPDGGGHGDHNLGGRHTQPCVEWMETLLQRQRGPVRGPRRPRGSPEGWGTPPLGEVVGSGVQWWR